MNTLIASQLAAAAIVFAVFAPARADAPVEGELWDTTAEASIPGVAVNVPPYRAKLCQKKEWTSPPQTQDPKQNCKATDFVRTANKITWSMTCANPPMTGEGEIAFSSSDAYEGHFTMHMPKFDMHMALTGKKIGSCENPG